MFQFNLPSSMATVIQIHTHELKGSQSNSEFCPTVAHAISSSYFDLLHPNGKRKCIHKIRQRKTILPQWRMSLYHLLYLQSIAKYHLCLQRACVLMRFCVLSLCDRHFVSGHGPVNAQHCYQSSCHQIIFSFKWQNPLPEPEAPASAFNGTIKLQQPIYWAINLW